MGLFSNLFGGKKNNLHQQSEAENLLQEIEVAPGIFLPKAIAEYWPTLSKAKKNYISIKATPAKKFTLQQSKLLHFPSIPKDFPYPVDSAGKYMIPLAQINFKECPKLEGLPDSGYLQFYIANNDVYGLSFDDQQTQSDFRVLYFKEEDVTDPHQDFSFLADIMNAEYTPVHSSHMLSFQLKQDYLGLGDYQSDKNTEPIMSQIYKKYPTIEDKLTDIMYDRFSGTGHKVGGFAYFTQEDPRTYNKEWRDYILLFQLDSDEEIMWGDVGVANFFIRPNDLADLNFSNIIYNWDCS